jgi:hypothetical protein
VNDLDARALARMRADYPALDDVPNRELRGTLTFAAYRLREAVADLYRNLRRRRTIG